MKRNMEDMKKFIDIWEAAESMEDVIKAFPDVAPSSLASRATALRKNSVPLKKFKPKHSKLNMDELAKYVESKRS